MLDENFNDPLNLEPDGSYITLGQMQFFLNRKDGLTMFRTGSEEFWDYYNLCRLYNLVSEIMEYDSTEAIMYWNHKKGVVSMSYPKGGVVADAISQMELHTTKKNNDDEWGSGLN